MPVVVYNIPGAHGRRPRARDARAHRRGGAERRGDEGGDGQRAPRAEDRPDDGLAHDGAQRRRRADAADDVAVGARGVISVTSNVLPAEVSRATRLALDGKWDEARRAHLALLPVHEAMFVEANPSPVKAALAMRGGMISDVVRGPLAACIGGRRARPSPPRSRRTRRRRAEVRLAVVGASGRMGRAVVRLAHEAGDRARVRGRRDRDRARRRASSRASGRSGRASSTASPPSSTRAPTSSSTSRRPAATLALAPHRRSRRAAPS